MLLALGNDRLTVNGTKLDGWFQPFPDTVPQKTPNAPRTDVFPSPNGSQAKPDRGARWAKLSCAMPRGTPGSPGYTKPVGIWGWTIECCPGTKAAWRLSGSVGGVWISQRKPRLSVRRWVIR